MDSFSVTPRLRVPRNPHFYSDRSQLASTIEGPSRFPEQTQLLDMDMNDVAVSETTEQSRPHSSTTPLAPAGRSPTPADNLRALMMRLPATDTSSTPRAPSPAPYEFSERESDFDSDMDTTDLADAQIPPTSAHEHAKALFQKARSEHSYSSRKDYSSRSPSEKSPTGASMIAEGNTTGLKGKQPSFLVDENYNANPNESIPRPPRRRSVAPPLTKEFLRERFSESRIDPEPASPNHNSSNETATILRDLSDMNASAPQATSTPMQSLRMSFSGQYQSNLLDQDTEMQRAIDDQDSSNSLHLPPSSTPTVRRRPLSRQRTPSSPDFVDTSKTPTANTYRLAAQMEKRNKMRSPSISGKDKTYTPHEPSSPDWEQTPKARRPADEHPSDYELDDADDVENPGAPLSDKRHSREEDNQPNTSYRSQDRASNSFIPRPTAIPYISINGHRSVSLSRARSASISSAGSQNDQLEDDDLPESEPEQTSSRLSYAYSTPRSAHLTQPATARRIRDTTSRSVDQPRADEELEHPSHTQRSTTPVESPGHGLRNGSPRHDHQSVDRSVEREHSHVVQRSTTPNESPGHHLRYEESRSRSPPPTEQPNSMSRTASLQSIDNTYHLDASERNSSRGGTSTPASVKKQSSSSSYLSAASPNNSSKSSSSSSTSPRGKKQREPQQTWQTEEEPGASAEASPQPALPRMKSTSKSTRFMSASPPWSPVDEEPSHLQRRVAKRASAEVNNRPDLAGEPPKMRSMFPAHVNDYDDSYQTQPRPSSRQQEKQRESQSTPSSGGLNLLDDRTPPSFHDVSLTPPRNSSTPKNHAAAAAREPKSPSSSVVLPDLPTPSSSDESETEHDAQQHRRSFATPKPPSPNGRNGQYQYQNGYGNEASWMPTPKPPGGWLQTPMPAARRAQAEPQHVREASSRDDGGDYADASEVEVGMQYRHRDGEQEAEADGMVDDPKTPLRQPQQEYEYGDAPGTTMKTPRFPGAWRTPGPVTPAPPKQSSSSSSPPPPPPSQPSSPALQPPSTQFQGQRHQGLLTPVNSLSRAAAAQQDPKTPYVTGGWVNTPAARKSILKVRFTPKEEEDNGGVSDRTSGGTHDAAALSTPHRSIRVLDAFGREQPAEAVSEGAVEPKLEEEDESRAEESSESSRPMSRADVLQDIRKKISTLVEDIEEIDSETKSHDDERVRIEELSAVSRRARDRRAQLESESGKALVKSRFRVSSPNMFSAQVGLRFYFILFLVQVFVILLMYRLSVIRAKHIFLNSYYDPFHPDLHVYVLKYDNFLPHLDCDTSGMNCHQFPLGHSLHTNLLHFLGYLRSYLPPSWNGVVQQSPGWWPS